MAKNPLLKINFATNSNPPYLENDELIVYFDDATFFPYHTLNGVQLIDPAYDIKLGQPFTKSPEDQIAFEYKVTFLDANFQSTGGLELNYVKPIPSTPNQDDPHIGQPVFPPPPPPPVPPANPVLPLVNPAQNTNKGIPNRPADLKFN